MTAVLEAWIKWTPGSGDRATGLRVKFVKDGGGGWMKQAVPLRKLALLPGTSFLLILPASDDASAPQ